MGDVFLPSYDSELTPRLRAETPFGVQARAVAVQEVAVPLIPITPLFDSPLNKGENELLWDSDHDLLPLLGQPRSQGFCTTQAK